MIEWLVEKLAPLVKRYWVTLLLVGLLVSILIYSLDAANWVKQDQPMITAFSAGLAIGWLLAASHLRGLFAAFYAILTGALLTIETLARVVPTPAQVFGVPFFEIVNGMNLRAFEFSLRAAGWVTNIQAGEPVEDVGLFLLLLGYLLLLAAVWWLWWIVRRRNVLAGIAPLALLLAVNIHLTQQSLVTYMAFLFLTLLLIVRMQFNRIHEDWERRRVDYPDQLGLEWGMSALAAAAVIVMLARVVPLVSTQEGWQLISKWLEETRRKTEETTDQLFAGVNPPPPPIDATPVVYATTPNLGDIGNPVPQGNQTVMWVRISDPPPIPPEIGINVPVNVNRIHYWRSGIYDVYNGRGWEPVPLAEAVSPQPETLPETPPLGRYYLRQDFTIEARTTSGILFSTNDPVQASEGIALRRGADDPSYLLEGEQDGYTVISLATDVTANQLAEAPVQYPAEITAAYLQIPESMPNRIRQLANRLAGGTTNPYLKAIAIQDYLRANFPYDLNVDPAPASRDVVDYFLFDAKRGYCSHYATAMAVMLRSEGVPARVATGYAMGDWVQEEQGFRVPVSYAHAWVEVYFPGIGWVEFEPTAYRTPIVYSEDRPMDEPPPVMQIEPETPTQTPAYIAYLVIAAALGLIALPFVLLRLFSTARGAPAVQADVLYRRMRRALAWAGLPAAPSVTPDEYLSAYGPKLAEYRQIETALRRATDIYREMAYSPHPPDERKVRAAGALWQQSISEWVKMVVKVKWRRLRGKGGPTA